MKEFCVLLVVVVILPLENVVVVGFNKFHGSLNLITIAKDERGEGRCWAFEIGFLDD